VDVLPRPPAALQSLRHLVAGARFPQVSDIFSSLSGTDTSVDGGAASGTPGDSVPGDSVLGDSVPGDSVSAKGASVADSRSSGESAVLVRSEGCRLTSEGSGVAVGPTRIVTNAHVVAGGHRVEIEDVDGTRRAATVVAFNPVVDLALLEVAGLTAAPRSLGIPRRGTTVAIPGHPGGGRLRVAIGRVRRRITTRGFDIYDRRRATRDVLVLSAALRPGDSGAGVLDGDGSLVGVAFAVAPDAEGVAYAVTAADVRRFLGAVPAGGGLATAVANGRCLG
jgi:S1-C subfamily serine protease